MIRIVAQSQKKVMLIDVNGVRVEALKVLLAGGKVVALPAKDYELRVSHDAG
jgi:hypothetical protein